MEETKITNNTKLKEMLVEFKNCLEKQFNQSFDYETVWVYTGGTAGWNTALEQASKIYFPAIYKIYSQLDYVESDNFDDWLLDCALAHGVCKPMNEDPVYLIRDVEENA